MRYCIGDIHGDREHLVKMLEKIKFNPEEDYVYFLGDVVGRGPEQVESLKIVRKMIADGHATMLLGNHEYFIMYFMEGFFPDYKWVKSGAGDMKECYDNMTYDQRQELYGFLDSLPSYVEIESPFYGKTMLVHAGICDDETTIVRHEDGIIDTMETMKRQRAAGKFIFSVTKDLHELAKDENYKLDRFIICGHVPTFRLGKEEPYEAFVCPQYIDIDTGNGYRTQKNGRICCYCVDTDEFFYE